MQTYSSPTFCYIRTSDHAALTASVNRAQTLISARVRASECK